MISEKFSTNPESFIKFERGRRIGWRLHMDTPINQLLFKILFIVSNTAKTQNYSMY
jgi:hypothetical protein